VSESLEARGAVDIGDATRSWSRPRTTRVSPSTASPLVISAVRIRTRLPRGRISTRRDDPGGGARAGSAGAFRRIGLTGEQVSYRANFHCAEARRRCAAAGPRPVVSLSDCGPVAAPWSRSAPRPDGLARSRRAPLTELARHGVCGPACWARNWRLPAVGWRLWRSVRLGKRFSELGQQLVLPGEHLG
jgi:hypothetical protein